MDISRQFIVSRFNCSECKIIQTAFIDAISLKRHAVQQATPLRCGKAIRINFLDDKTSNERNKKEDEDNTSISIISNEIGSLSF